MESFDQNYVKDTFTKRLKEIRKEKGFSKEWVAEKAQISLDDYIQIESGNIFNYDISIVIRIAYILDIDVNYLLGWSDEKRVSYQNELLNKYDINNPSERIQREILHLLSLFNEDELNKVKSELNSFLKAQ